MPTDLALPSGGLRSRAVWVFGDSALSSLTNAGLTIGLAKTVSAGEYGAFALAFTLFSLVQSASMALNNQAVVIRYADADAGGRRRAGAAAAAGSVVVGAAAGLALVVTGIAIGGEAGAALIAMGLVMPALMVQDHWRTTFIAFGEPRRAFGLDLVWGLVWGVGFVVAIYAGVRGAGPYIVIWGLGALVSAALGAWLAKTGIDLGATRRWFTGHTEVTVPSLANTFATVGAAQVAFLVITLVGSISTLGALRGVQTLLGPLNIVGSAVVAFATPELVRRRPDRRGLLVAAAAMSAFTMATAAVWGGILLLLPDAAGTQLLGDTWTEARRALPGMVLYQVALLFGVGPGVVLRALNRVRSTFYLGALLGPLTIVCATIGVGLGGARGAAYGFAVAGLLVAPAALAFLLHWSKAGPQVASSEQKT